MVYLKMPWKITFSYNFVFTFVKHLKQKQIPYSSFGGKTYSYPSLFTVILSTISHIK